MRSPLSDIQSFADQHRLKARICAEDGTKIVVGRMGQIYEHSDGLLAVLILPDPPRQRYWGRARAALVEAGLTITQDGDGEGAATFDPDNPKQAKAAVRAAGVKCKRQMSPAQREQRIAFLRAAQERHLAPQERLLSESQGLDRKGTEITDKPALSDGLPELCQKGVGA